MKTTMMALVLPVVLLLQDMASVTSIQSTQPDLLAGGMIRSATFMERSPEFTDLYQIQTPDKGRQIVIFCNSSYCYRHRSQTLNA